MKTSFSIRTIFELCLDSTETMFEDDLTFRKSINFTHAFIDNEQKQCRTKKATIPGVRESIYIRLGLLEKEYLMLISASVVFK